MAKSVEGNPAHLARCSVKSRYVFDLTRDEVRDLMGWCDCQTESLWDGMKLQEILNVYRVSAEWQTWEDWADEDRPAAHRAWNRAVIQPGNKMAKRES